MVDNGLMGRENGEISVKGNILPVVRLASFGALMYSMEIRVNIANSYNINYILIIKIYI